MWMFILWRGFFSWFSGNKSNTDLDKQLQENELEVKMLKKAHNELFLGNHSYKQGLISLN